ncbi:pyridoxal phosphate-dependent aminotransferase [Acidisphaera sp. S103]|uniref:pyridoxal phosphate-dependent aminotransferase n=1 Tax=Acidisphaera sp. S103 TaxID=1747223 RepID=UPI00131DCFDD|nr:pyridoxal phosphate-dependent aminotransferase [Acidisphaera sp. S103]
MAHFPTNDIMTLVGPAPRFDLAESFGPDLHLHDVLGPDDIPLGYGSTAGDPGLRAIIAERNGVAPDNVVVTMGGMHALFLVAFILCDPGDEAITTAPVFPLARAALETVGAEIRTVRLNFDHRYQPDPADIRAALSVRTKLVSLASPQNPSGSAIPPETVRAILDAMREVCPDAYLLADETYREAVYGDDPAAPSLVDLGPKVVSVASLSKCHGAPGLRIGWAITRDPVLRQQLILGKFSTVISCSAVDEALACRVLRHSHRSRHDHFAACLASTAAWIRQNADRVEWVRPDAGAICCVRLHSDRFDDAAVSRFYDELASHGIRVANGTWFGDEARVFRLGFGLLPLQDLEAALAGVSAALDKESMA